MILNQQTKVILEGCPETVKELPNQIRDYWSYRDELSVENGSKSMSNCNNDRVIKSFIMIDRSAEDLPILGQGAQVTIQDPATCKWNVKDRCPEPRSYQIENENGNVVRHNRQ